MRGERGHGGDDGTGERAQVDAQRIHRGRVHDSMQVESVLTRTYTGTALHGTVSGREGITKRIARDGDEQVGRGRT